MVNPIVTASSLNALLYDSQWCLLFVAISKLTLTEQLDAIAHRLIFLFYFIIFFVNVDATMCNSMHLSAAKGKPDLVQPSRRSLEVMLVVGTAVYLYFFT